VGGFDGGLGEGSHAPLTRETIVKVISGLENEQTDREE
jgi:hypothetical protein